MAMETNYSLQDQQSEIQPQGQTPTLQKEDEQVTPLKEVQE